MNLQLRKGARIGIYCEISKLIVVKMLYTGSNLSIQSHKKYGQSQWLSYLQIYKFIYLQIINFTIINMVLNWHDSILILSVPFLKGLLHWLVLLYTPTSFPCP